MHKDVTMLVAHPDDEFLFGFPAIHRAKKIIACVDDTTHPTRAAWCSRRKEAFADVCKLVGAECQVLRYDSGFRGLEHKAMQRFTHEVFQALKGAEMIFTHNAWGEYGHWDHIVLNSLVKQAGVHWPIITTDICLQADWYPVRPHRQGHLVSKHENDLDFHERCMDIYRAVGAMGWDQPPVTRCNLVEVFI